MTAIVTKNSLDKENNTDKYVSPGNPYDLQIKRHIKKISWKALLVNMYPDQLDIFKLYSDAGVKSKSEVFRLLIDSHELLRILLRNSDILLNLTPQDQWPAEDLIIYLEFIKQFKQYEDTLQTFLQTVKK